MLMPSVFGENLFDDFFNFPSGSFAADSMDLMKTDVKESENGYEITMNLDIKARFEDGTLKMAIPKKEQQPAVEKKKYIAIEG